MVSKYSHLANIFENKWGNQSWFNGIMPYLEGRYSSIEERFMDSFRYVEPHPANRLVFSYEYSSILRDTGSAFDSVMRKLLEGLHYPHTRGEYDFGDYRKFLKENVVPQTMFGSKTLTDITVTVDSHHPNRFLMPFLSLENEGKLEWWDAYNNVKHSDIDRRAHGNLGNCLSSVATLSVLLTLMSSRTLLLDSRGRIRLFPEIGVFEPTDSIRKFLFAD